MKLLLFLPILFFFQQASAQYAADTINNWQIYLDDSLITADNSTFLEVRQKPISTELLLTKTKPNSRITIKYNTCVRNNNYTQQLYLAGKDSVRLTQRYFKPNQLITITVKELLSLKQKELWLYYLNDYVTKPGGKPNGHVIGSLRIIQSKNQE